MKNKKARIFGKTQAFDKTSKQSNFKAFQVARQYPAKKEANYVS